jgi:hypothetical protein
MGAYEARPFTITPISGDQMAARVHDPFPQPIAVRVNGTDGDPVDGGIISFRSPLEGAGAQFSHPDVVIYQDKASTGVAANSVPGAYEVTATARGAMEAHFHLLNRDFTPRVYLVTPHGAADDPTCGQTWSASCVLQYTLRSLAVSDDQVWVAKETTSRLPLQLTVLLPSLSRRGCKSMAVLPVMKTGLICAIGR